ncbi:MAG: chemotaxis protein CheW, partial [Myxococcales bacterium]
GGAALLGLDAIRSMAHAMESPLALLRDGRLIVKPPLMAALLDGLDSLGAMLSDVAHSQTIPCDRELEALRALVQGHHSAPPVRMPILLCPPHDVAQFARTLVIDREQLSEPVPPTPLPPPRPSQRVFEAMSGAPAEAVETLRVRVALLTQLMNLAGELVLGRNQLLRALSGLHRDIPGLTPILLNINQVTTDLQEGILQTRMQPVGAIFARAPRIVRDIAARLGKSIHVELLGSDVELDKSIVECLVDPLTHILRNAADHGIESPAERVKAGKSAEATIVLHAYHQAGQVILRVADDGAGIDANRVVEHAIAKGVITPSKAKELSERERLDLIFAPGLSTARTVSDISGRGVGMDVVRTNVEKLGGHVEVDTHVGQGTTVLMRLPLTLAIIPSMIVGVCGQRMAIPQTSIVEFVWVRAAEAASRVERIHDAEVLRLRDQRLPLVHLAKVLRLPSPPSWQTDSNVVVLRLGPNRFGLVVDELFDIEEIVVKPLSTFVQACKCFSGATILGDGRVVMILDAAGVAAQARLRFPDLGQEEAQRLKEEARRAELAALRRRSIVLFAAAASEYFAVAQDRILRIERILASQIQRVGSREFVEYRGEGLPLVRLDRHLEVEPIDCDAEELFLIIPKVVRDGRGISAGAGLVISNIVDALDVEVDLGPSAVRGPGVLGSSFLQGHVTLFLEPLELLRAAGVIGVAA